MGSKRFFDEGHFHEYPSKRKADYPVEKDGFYFEDDKKKVVFSHMTEKEVEISAPYSWVTSSSSEEEGGLSAVVSSSLSAQALPEEIHTYSSSLYGTPAIHIPLGLDHQAKLPQWIPRSVVKYRLGYDHVMGDCVIPLPIRTQIEVRVGHGRKGCCDCADEGSLMCIQQHVRDARERLRADLGPEKFVKLGFCDMGEDISQLWTEEEERVFHQVVYSNPVSHNKNFWENLSVVFPTRTKKEIVSYYFNVFMLRRRSVQNRTRFLEIDSDDDERNVGYSDTLENDDSASDSLNVKEVKYADDLPVANEINGNESGCNEGSQENGGRSSVDGFDAGYLMEESHGKFWNDGFQMSPLRFTDFLSTGQMIEELFGASPSSESMF